MTINVTFWGVRGSVPCASLEHMQYGGNTACVEVDLDGNVIVFDAGSGLRILGRSLAQRDVNYLSLFLTHFHWDHICGFPFFFLAYKQGAHLDIYSSPSITEKSAQDVLNLQMSDPLFPATMQMLPSEIDFKKITYDKDISLFNGQAKIKALPLHHPNGATGYRLDYKGKSVAYISDHEHANFEEKQILIDFVKDVDLMIFDAMYTPEQYKMYQGWGHSTWEDANDIALKANVRKTALFHHNPMHSDEEMAKIEETTKALNKTFFVAKEQLTVKI